MLDEGGDLSRLQVQAVRFSTSLIAHAITPPFHARWERDREDARTRIMFVFVNRGTLELEGDQEHWTAPGGGLGIVFPGRTPVNIKATEDSEMVFFSFDEREVRPLKISPANIGAVSPTSTVFRASYGYLQAAAHHPRTSREPTENPGILRSLTRDVARALTSAALAEVPGERLFAEAERVIADNYRDPTLSADDVATRCRVSRSTLERSFRSRELGVAGEIRRARAQHAMALVTSDPNLPLDLVARASGFGSRSSMDRALLSLYRTSSSALRLT